MLFSTHILSGLLVGKYLGHTGAILLGTTIIDFDHLFDIFIKGQKKGRFKRLFEVMFLPHPEEDETRTVFHSFLAWLVISVIFYNLAPGFGLYFSIGYLLHLVLDSLDTSRLHLFYPRKYDVRGWVEYNSLMEYVFGIAIFIIYFFF